MQRRVDVKYLNVFRQKHFNQTDQNGNSRRRLHLSQVNRK